jgi:hypothetical protein
MGIDISTSIVVGLEYHEFGEGVIESEVFELERVSPSFDCPNYECVFGCIVLNTETYKQLTIEDLHSDIAEAHVEFKNITGLQGKLFISPDVW